MNTLYLDCQAGVSGDMTVAALLDIGVPLEYLEGELAKLPLPADSYRLSAAATNRHGISAVKFDVTVYDQHTHRHYTDIIELISAGRLSERVKESSCKIFRRLAEAEAKVHGVPVEEVHFHEVGAIDSIVDIVGVAICLDFLKIERICVSSLPLCSGFIECEHGLLPLPAPATAELMKGMPTHGCSGPGERVTPTGAAIVAALADSFGVPDEMKIEKIGTGAGGKDFPDIPNILRAFSGISSSTQNSNRMMVIEANIDDSTPEVLGYALERLFAEGAADVWWTPIQMKKCRPAVLLSIIVHPENVEKFTRIIFTETTAIGLRSYPVSRQILERRIEERETCFGKVRFKVTDYGEKPEFEDCRRIALETGLALRHVLRTVQKKVPEE
jgi:uncharacterized protein (TIGR00299 family) protein